MEMELVAERQCMVLVVALNVRGTLGKGLKDNRNQDRLQLGGKLECTAHALPAAYEEASWHVLVSLCPPEA